MREWQILEAPNFTIGRDRYMRSRTFLHEIQFQTNFIRTFFHIMRIFGSVELRN